ncbi:MAG: hypothetical protein ACYDBH_25075, partial [Acidobacteriaceae bacterium]
PPERSGLAGADQTDRSPSVGCPIETCKSQEVDLAKLNDEVARVNSTLSRRARRLIKAERNAWERPLQGVLKLHATCT